jgi:hypothetical protein
VIDWGKEAWRLGLAPGTLEHLEKLYIDQDGKIHRVERNGDGNEVAPPEAARDQVSLKHGAKVETLIQEAAAVGHTEKQ